MENITKEYKKVRRCADVYTETSADYSLPDYNGDIKRVLYTAAAVCPASKYNEDEAITASGIVSYDVIYVNSENKIDRISFTSDYDVSAKMNDKSVEGADIETRISSFSHRLTGPRRINMKASLTSEVRVIEACEIETDYDSAASGDAECVLAHPKIQLAEFAHSDEREYAEAVAALEGVMEDEVEILHSSCNYTFDEVKAEDGGVSLRGAHNLSVLIRCADGAPILYKKRIPFEEFLAAEGVEAGMNATAYANINSISCAVTAEESGVSVGASVIAEYCIRAYGNKECSVVRDAYLKSCGSEVKYEDFLYTTHLGCDKKSHTATHTIPLSDVCEWGVKNVILATAAARPTGTEISEGEALVNAEIKIFGITESTDEDGENIYGSIKSSFQIAEKVSFGCQIPDDASVECKIRVCDVCATIDEENMYVDVTYSVDAVAEANEKLVRLCSLFANSEEKFEKHESEIIVYYPTSEDTLFGIAKAFHTSVAHIAKTNMLTESVMNSFDSPVGLSGIKKLIIK